MTDPHYASLRKFERGLRQARMSIDTLVPTQVVHAFITVALNEGHTLTELSEVLGTNVSTASRQLLDLGDQNRRREPGYMLVETRIDPMNLRVNRYYLTNKGKMLARELDLIMKD